MSSEGDSTHPSLLAIAWPIFIEQTLRILIGTVDTFMVSHVSDGAVAALGVANQFVTLALVFFNFIGIGASVVVTHYVGAGDLPGAKRISATAIAVNTWIGIIASVIGITCAGLLLRLAQLPPELMVYAKPFLALMGGTLFLEAMNTAIGASLRAHGFTKDAMVVTVTQNLLNVAASSILVFGFFGAPKLGVTGAALASIFSRLVASAVFWTLLIRRLRLHLKVRDFLSMKLEPVKRILHIGLPAAGENLSYWVALMVITSFAGRLGSRELATMTYTLNVQRVVILFSISLGLGTEIVIGRLVGKGAFEAAHRQLVKSVKTGLMVATAGILIVAAAAPQLLKLFSADPLILAQGIFLLRLSILYEPGRVFNIVIINSLRATGDARYPIRIAVLSEWLLSVPLCYVFGIKLGYGLTGIWIVMMTEEWVRGLAMAHRWASRKWLAYAEHSRTLVAVEVVPPTSIES